MKLPEEFTIPATFIAIITAAVLLVVFTWSIAFLVVRWSIGFGNTATEFSIVPNTATSTKNRIVEVRLEHVNEDRLILKEWCATQDTTRMSFEDYKLCKNI